MEGPGAPPPPESTAPSKGPDAPPKRARRGAPAPPSSSPRMPRRWRLVLNVLLHVFLLFLILRTFFYHVVREAEQAALQRQLRHSIQSTLGGALPKIDASLHGSLCEAIHRHRGTLDALDRFYSRPSPVTHVYNAWLSTATLLVALALGLLFVAVYTSLRLACGYEGELLPLIAQNVIIFLVVGALEFLFFRDVASQYIPVMPSYLYGEVVRSLQAKIPPPPPSSAKTTVFVA